MSSLRSVGGKLAEYALTGLLLVVSISVVFGYILDAPVLLTFVETGSMEPTITAGDGFIAIPSAVTTAERGDVVSFRPDMIEGGRITTHRIVGETENGYITQGDNNIVTDQDGGEPAVTEGQIVAVAFSINDRVVTIPHLGTTVGGLRTGVEQGQQTISALLGINTLQGSTGLSYILFAFGIIVYVVVLVFGKDAPRTTSRTTDRSTGIPGWVFTVVAATLVMSAASIGMIAPGGTQTYGIVSGSGDSSAPHVIEQGTSEDREYPVGNAGILPVVVYIDSTSQGVTVQSESYRLNRGETANMTMVISAPEENGYYIRSFREYRYPLLLPKSTLDGLFSIHPALPFVTINAMVGGTVLGIGTALGGGSTRIRYQRRQLSKNSRF
jgi:signal peptidase